MKTFSARISTDAEIASIDVDAETPEQALAKAREIAEGDDIDSLPFEPYSEAHPVNEVVIEDEDGAEVAAWQDEDLRLRLHAGTLLSAAQIVLDCWERGDLAEAVRGLGEAVNVVKSPDGSEQPAGAYAKEEDPPATPRSFLVLYFSTDGIKVGEVEAPSPKEAIALLREAGGRHPLPSAYLAFKGMPPVYEVMVIDRPSHAHRR
ncbi:hypothetical protein ACVIHI_007971 [Bradyrhizobium sp. USDA 4524]|uniref:hypothetical protein n=1 Tax=unclassified Bradyrhizobium TaxID=2631580 RepID=UPI0020A082F1|nr:MULTISPECIES: hypothetical protein [unclassified Bradyrhizobium]MCP1839115.1 hypothetical protein [Bradyrhizobium sp. USDA 4538]MCP1899680.1 hypothetical protein [Bradyrhizobium sp. USDA 4537]MCP1986210.1 hypothetical protein [Bradyrhizobium sp. USDA 4539]